MPSTKAICLTDWSVGTPSSSCSLAQPVPSGVRLIAACHASSSRAVRKLTPPMPGVCALLQVKTSVEDAVLLGDVSDHRQDSETTLLTGCFPPHCHDTLLPGPAPFEASAWRHVAGKRGCN